MHKSTYLLTLICLLAMTGLLGLQCYWITKYYSITKQDFENKVNAAYSDAFKKEFAMRADTVQQRLIAILSDTNLYSLSSKINEKYQRVSFTLRSKKEYKDTFSSTFSLSGFNKLIQPGDKELKSEVIKRFAETIRTEDFENHTIYYRTQTLGGFMSDLTDEFDFDTLNLRPVLNRYLIARNIHVPYSFYVSSTDSTTNYSTFPPALIEQYPIITRSFPTYSNQPYVRVLFKNPVSYILSNMWLIFVSSILLVVLIACSMYFLLKSLKKEKRLSAIKNDFISNITHEFKTPIATATVAIEALSDRTVIEDEEKATRYLNHTKNELKRISSLTDKILKLSLYEDGNYKIKKEFIDVNGICKELIAIHELSEKSVVINYENDTDIEHLYVDRVQFQHALSNIIENAIKYGNEAVNIKISCVVDGDYFVISLKDNGPGVPENEIPLVFEKFYRVKQGVNAPVKGYGLGLNYVKQIMEHHTGWYKMMSSTQGTELKLGWPL